MNEKLANKLAVAFSITYIAVGTLTYIKTMRVEREKRKKIEAWRQENLACVDNFRKRLIEMAQSPDVDASEYWKAFAEESEFLKIVQNQPKY